MIGRVVGNYKLVQKIGEGGMGTVFKGIDVMLEREVAVKVLRPELAGDSNVLERFRSEAVTLAKLNHPNIATLYSFFRDCDEFFMVMEYVRGETVDSLLRRQGPLSPDLALALFCQALDGIGHAHKSGIIHRDIKPANLMVTAEEGAVKVMDFGIARALGSARMTREGRIVGTIEYMAPEQIRGQETDTRSDVYALGAVLYEMTTGQLPFSSDSEYELMRSQIELAPQPPRDVNPSLPLEVESAIMRALAKLPEARFPTANEFRRHLTETLGVPAPATTGSLATGNLIAAPISSDDCGALAPSSGGAAAIPAVGADEKVKETRLATDVLDTPAQASPYTMSPPPKAPPVASLLGSLQRKHYLFAAGGLLVALGIPLLMLALGGGAPAPPPKSPPKPPESLVLDTPPSTLAPAPADVTTPPSVDSEKEARPEKPTAARKSEKPQARKKEKSAAKASRDLLEHGN